MRYEEEDANKQVIGEDEATILHRRAQLSDQPAPGGGS
jgi:hypothetical protein